MDYHTRNSNIAVTPTTNNNIVRKIVIKTSKICMLNKTQSRASLNELTPSLTPTLIPKPNDTIPDFKFEDKRPSQVTAVDFSIHNYNPQLLQSMTSDAGAIYRKRTISNSNTVTSQQSFTFTNISSYQGGCSIQSSVEDSKTSISPVIEEYDDRSILWKYGYEKVKEMRQTSQGVVIEAIRKKTGETVAIKRCDKILHANHEARQDGISGISMDGTNQVIEENIVHEATVLRYLTYTQSSALDFMCRFVQFFESDNDYYLVMEYGGNVTLQEFASEAMIYIKDGSLISKEWKRTIKFLFWQLSVLMVWLHRDMNCCHMDICTNNVVLQNANFVRNENSGNIEIDADINIKLTDFGLAEVFNTDNARAFDCMKFEDYSKNYRWHSPNRFKQRKYDAKKSDVWSMGIVLYSMLVGRAPFKYQDKDKKDPRFWLLRHKKFPKLLQVDHQKSFNLKLVNLFGGLFAMKDHERMKMSDIVHHKWFKTYYSNYAEQIIENSQEIEDLRENEDFQKRMKVFPFYKGVDTIQLEY